MEFLKFLEGIRTPFFNGLFSLITELGGETLFLVISIIFFWCVSKREGYYILLSGLFGTLINQTMKLAFRIPRPEKLIEGFTIVESAREGASGYSFPSGHTQNVACTFGAIAVYNRKRWLAVLCGVIILLVSFSRMYLGVHTPLDVGVSLLISAVLVGLFFLIFRSEERFRLAFPYIVVSAVALSALYLAFVLFIKDDATLDVHNLESGMKNACTLLGCTAGLVLVYFIDGRFTDFKTEARWYAQIVKVIIGFGAVLLIKEGLRTPLGLLFGGNAYVARAVRYFLVVGFAGAVWPLTFRRFSEWRVGFLEKFSAWLKSVFCKKA